MNGRMYLATVNSKRRLRPPVPCQLSVVAPLEALLGTISAAPTALQLKRRFPFSRGCLSMTSLRRRCFHSIAPQPARAGYLFMP